MPDSLPEDLALQLAAANVRIAELTASGLALTNSLSDAESRIKRLKRGARRDESSFKEQIQILQSKRG